MENKNPIPQPKSPSKSFRKIIPEKEHGFTLVELIVVIIIVGILAAVGLSQYSDIVEKGRTVEAKIRIGAMRQLAYEYYLNNGTLATITDSDVGVDNTCASSSFYKYYISSPSSTMVDLVAYRCASGGKTPNASRVYYIYRRVYPDPSAGQEYWRCWYLDDTTCFGMGP